MNGMELNNTRIHIYKRYDTHTHTHTHTHTQNTIPAEEEHNRMKGLCSDRGKKKKRKK